MENKSSIIGLMAYASIMALRNPNFARYDYIDLHKKVTMKSSTMQSGVAKAKRLKRKRKNQLRQK